ncbi:MAG: hydrogenase formation protein HypD [Cyanobium sp.]
MVKAPGAAGGAAVTAPVVKALALEVAAIVSRPWTLMEVCGGQTHAIVRWGLDQLLPEGLRLLHGPGCPVCVTPAATIEQALQLARLPEVILCSYGDMLRVPGEGRDSLLAVRAGGGDVRLLTSPLQALTLAGSHPDRQVVFLAVGFETTAPATALLARQVLALGVRNLSVLCAHVRVSPAMEAILAEPDNRVQGFLAAGHVCSVLGTAELEGLVRRRHVPVVVSGFEPSELMRALLACVSQLEAGQARVENAYGAVVRQRGNPEAIRLLEEVFVAGDQPWRGIGVLPAGGLFLRGRYRQLDARRRFGLEPPGARVAGDRQACAPCSGGGVFADAQPEVLDREHAGDRRMPASGCIAGSVLRGQASPLECPAFGTACTPEHPLGAPMVSSEGACAAYLLHRPRCTAAAASATSMEAEPGCLQRRA